MGGARKFSPLQSPRNYQSTNEYLRERDNDSHEPELTVLLCSSSERSLIYLTALFPSYNYLFSCILSNFMISQKYILL